MDEVRKKSLKELLPKNGIGLAPKKTTGVRRKKIEDERYDLPAQAGSPSIISSGYAPRAGKRVSMFVWFCILLVVLAGGYFLSTKLARATVKISPRQATFNVTGQFSAAKAPVTSGLEFSVIKLEETKEMTVTATEQKRVETKAGGKVTITNNYSSAPQRLVASTRLSAPDGAIFRLIDSVTVPGSGGQVTVLVTADIAGKAGNIAPTSFKIVGFKGTAKYDKFAVSSDKDFTGGQSGLVNLISESERKKAEASLQADLKIAISKKAKLQIPADYIIFDDGMIFDFTSRQKENVASSSEAVLEGQMSLIAVLFKSSNLSGYLALRQNPDEPVEGLKVANLTDLQFQWLDKEKFDADRSKTINFKLTGNAKLIWPIKTEEIKSKLAGLSFTESDTVFKSYPNIYRAEASISPFWLKSFPLQTEKINVELIN